MGNRVDERRVGQSQVDAQQDVEDALVRRWTPGVHEKVVVGICAPARSAKEAQQEVDDEAHNCMHSEMLPSFQALHPDVCAKHIHTETAPEPPC